MAHIKQLHVPPVSIVDKKVRDWKVREGATAPRMSFEEGTMWIPLDDSEVSRNIRSHEMAHVRWTPEDAYQSCHEQCGVPFDATKRTPLAELINAAEDGRINSHLTARGIRAPVYSEHPTYDRLSVHRNMARHPMVAAMYRFAAHGTEWAPEAQKLVEETQPADAEWINAQAERLTEAEFEVAAEVIRETHELYGKDHEDDPDDGDQDGDGQGGDGKSDKSGKKADADKKSGEGSASDGGSGDDKSDDGESESAGDTIAGGDGDMPTTPKPPRSPYGGSEIPADQAPWRATEALKEIADKEEEIEIEAPDDHIALEIEGNSEEKGVKSGIPKLLEYADKYSCLTSGKWCDMEVREPELTQALPRVRRAAKRAEHYGTVPRYAHRMVSDRKVFARKSSGDEYPGAVLVDVSGSMALSGAEVGKVLDSYPTAVICDYCGNGSKGVLRVIARNKKRLTDQELNRKIGMGNCVDGPALEWLAQQPRPRFWICDAVVTGKNDQPASNLFLEAAELCRKYRIIRISTVREFIEKYCY